MVQTICPKCKNHFDRGKEQTCKVCYEKTILKGQCLNMAATLLRNNLGEVTSSTPSNVFELAKELYREGLKQKYHEWEPKPDEK